MVKSDNLLLVFFAIQKISKYEGLSRNSVFLSESIFG